MGGDEAAGRGAGAAGCRKQKPKDLLRVCSGLDVPVESRRVYFGISSPTAKTSKAKVAWMKGRGGGSSRDGKLACGLSH